MGMVLKLERRPRTRQTPHEMRGEMHDAYDVMGTNVIADLDAEVAAFTDPPKFKCNVIITENRYVLTITVDRRTKAGRVFWWVDKGTGLYGESGTMYSIEPIEADYLSFVIPYMPLTIPPDGLNYDPLAEPKFIRTQHVDAPGIKPRKISEGVLKKYKDRKNTKGFYRTTENAYRRAFRHFLKSHR